MLQEGIQPFLPFGSFTQRFQQFGVIDTERLRGSVLAATIALFPLREEVEKTVIPVIAGPHPYFATLDLGLAQGLPLGVLARGLRGGLTGLGAGLNSGSGL